MTKRIMAVAIVLLVASLLTSLTTGLTAQPLQEQLTLNRESTLSDKVSPHKKTNLPLTAQAQGGLMWFTNQIEFEVYNCGKNVFLGSEDFEESILGPNDLDLFDDSLETDVPNAPDEFPFPDGLTGLPDIAIQSNLSGGNPTNPNPRGSMGLAATSATVNGSVSDVVLPNIIADSLDLIFFFSEKSSVGFNTIIYPGGDTVEIRVYSTDNVFLGMMTTPGDPAGSNFIGVVSPTPIGRINIFSAGGAEGADNIQAWDSGRPPCPSDINDDGMVNTADLLELFANWGPCP